MIIMSNELQLVFNFIRGDCYEKKDLSYRVFKDLDFEDLGPISFYRSDFRGSKFSTVIFQNNNFDLADFIGCTFLNVEYRNVIFGNCEIKNCFYKKCQFYNNSYSDSAIHNATFEKCIFEDETFRFTMFDCTFINCQFLNCVFDQCTTEHLTFIDCSFLKTEMSTMHAENFKFSKCVVRDTFLGACFLGTYLIKNTDMNLLSFKYRGEIVNIEDGFFETFIQNLFYQHRFFEYLNLLILSKKTKTIEKDFIETFPMIMSEKNANIRNYNISSIIEMLRFYYNTELLPFFSLLKIWDYLQSLDSSYDLIPKDSLLVFKESLFKLSYTVSQMDFDESYVLSIPSDDSCKFTIHCNDNSFDTVLAYIESLLHYANHKLNNTYVDPLYSIVEQKKGSVFITISTSLLLGLLAAKVVRQIYGAFCDIRIRKAKTKQAIKLIEESKNVSTFSKINALTETDNVKEQKDLMNIYNTLGVDYIIGIIIDFFL